MGLRTAKVVDKWVSEPGWRGVHYVLPGEATNQNGQVSACSDHQAPGACIRREGSGRGMVSPGVSIPGPSFDSRAEMSGPPRHPPAATTRPATTPGEPATPESATRGAQPLHRLAGPLPAELHRHASDIVTQPTRFRRGAHGPWRGPLGQIVDGLWMDPPIFGREPQKSWIKPFRS